ncbi:MAG: twin-arginine translocase subunit TatC [Candidatus Aminicenantes bacterium]|nr:twin-arginine translocase subunit TatC [Candidatus Aminicenantes bacterium]
MRKGKKSPDRMTFLEHLEDLRKRILYCIIAIVVAVIPAWFYSKDVYSILAIPVTQFLPEGEKLAFTTLTAPFMLYIKVSFLTAIFVTSPFIFLQFWMFVAPGLYKREKKYVIPFVSFTTIFFALGALFGYFVVFPWACRFFLGMGADFEPVITVDKYFSLALRVLLGIALVFELPTLVFFLSRMGIITSRWMVKNFKYAVLVIFIIAAIITPTPDMVTQSIIAGPMLALYGLSILIAFLSEKRRKERDKESEDEEKSEEGLAG